MNAQKLSPILRSKSKEYDVSVQSLYDVFFFEEFLKRLSKSSFNNKYVLKGGFLLENILGVEKRLTLDIDLSYRVHNINNVDVYVTGSNSRMLLKDALTEFRGRGDQIHVMPLSIYKLKLFSNKSF